MITPAEEHILVERLLNALYRRMVLVELVNWFPGQPKRRVVKDAMATPTITARAREYQPHDSIWLYWWLCWQPVRSVEDIKRVTDRFRDVVLAVERAQ